MHIKDYGLFLNDSEVNNLVNRIEASKESWIDYMPNVHKGLPEYDRFLILGQSIYVMNPKEKINTDIRNKMNLLFSDIYDKIVHFLEDKVQEEFGYRDDLPLPGFHISYLKHIPATRDYHVDNRILDRVPNVTSKAVICALSHADYPASLEYFDLSTKTDREQQYVLGRIYSWDHTCFHRISAKSLQSTKGSPRITLQSHYYYDKDLKKNILFF